MKTPISCICIDAGHGGHDSGAVGPAGLLEKTVALNVAQQIAGLLRGAGVQVVMTRETDEFIELARRAAIGNQADADLFVSIHCNSAVRQVRGFEVFTTPGRTLSDAAATECFKTYGEEFPTLPRRMDSSDGDPDKEANFAVLRLSQGPAILFELDFISDAEGELFLGDAANQARMALAIVRGILRFLGVLAAPGPVAPATNDRPAGPRPLPTVKAELRRLATEISNLAERA